MKEIHLNFGGFYGYHDQHIDLQIECLEIDSDSVDFAATYKDYAKEWLNAFNSEHDFDFEFVGIDSPLFYNHSTDKIKVNIDRLQCHILKRDYTRNVDFITYANERLKSSSGFISFYNGLEDLKQKAKENDSDYILLIEMILDFIIESNEPIFIDEFEIIPQLTYKTT